VPEITLTWVSGYRRSHRGRNNAPFIRSITHAPDQTYIRLQHLHCLFDLAVSTPFWIIAWIETIFMEFRGPKALVNLHGSRQSGNYPETGLRRDFVVGCPQSWERWADLLQADLRVAILFSKCIGDLSRAGVRVQRPGNGNLGRENIN
jgi:hypothetical protein